MNKKALGFLKELISKPTPTGWEQAGQEVVADYMLDYADRVDTDASGNVCGVINPDSPVRVMLAGHCDEIGLMVQHIDEQGFIFMSALGGVNVALLPGERIRIHTRKGSIPGVVGVQAIHLMDPKDREKPVNKLHELWVDIGARNRKDAEKLVQLGDTAVIDTDWIDLHDGMVAGRGFDDRIGAFIVADVLRRLKGKELKVGVYAVSTVQEEVGLRGARTAAYGIDPHVGLAIDVGFATDFPGVNEKIVGTAKLGEGPILHCGPTYNPHLLEMVQKKARAAKIKTQMQPEGRGMGTDAFAMRMTRSGVPVALFSVPTRYMHSPVETLCLKDVESTAELMAQTVLGINGKETWGRKTHRRQSKS